MSHQDQFLDVIDRDEAERRFGAVIRLEPAATEIVALDAALDRVLACDVVSRVDVPSFDRSNLDGFAVQAADTYGAREEDPRRLKLLLEIIPPGIMPRSEVTQGTAVSIATGAVLPRGADAIVMVEHADGDEQELIVRRAVTPGFGISFAGTDIAAGETVLRQGDRLTSRETGVLAAIGVGAVACVARPRVAILSTGDELVEPGRPMQTGQVFDSNARILADAVRELGGEPIPLGIVRDDPDQLRGRIREAVTSCDVVLLSGGTSKGAGDVSYRVVRELTDPGIVAHGVALKPGKPICLAATAGKPVVILPGFPTSAIFTFHEFVAPVIRRLAGLPQQSRAHVKARMAVKVNSEIGRTEYLLVGLVERPEATDASQAVSQSAPSEAPDTQRGKPRPSVEFIHAGMVDSVRLAAYPMGKGSGSVTTFSRADGFVTVDRHEEIVEAGRVVDVQLLSRDLQLADLVVIGSHCVHLDTLLGKLQLAGFRTKFLAVGSTAGLEAARRGECDMAGIHLLDPDTGQYNEPFVTPELTLVRGYGRLQGVVYRAGDARFEGKQAEQAIADVQQDATCVMVNRNRGSGTRILIDRLLGGARPRGYAVQSRNHNAVAAAVVQRRADWGVAIEGVARQAELGFLPLTEEQFDFVIPRTRRHRAAVEAFVELLRATGPPANEQRAPG